MSPRGDKSDILVAVTSAFGGLAITSVVIRIYTRAAIINCIGADDILIILGEFFALAQATTVIVATRHGLGRHTNAILPQEGKPIRILLWLAIFNYLCSATLVKLSLLAFYLRLSASRKFRNLVIFLIFLSAAAGISGAFGAFFQCHPLTVIWDLTPGKCIKLAQFYVSNAAIHIFSEILIYILPIRELWKLCLPTRQKFGLCSLMGIGAILIVISIYRMISVGKTMSSPDYMCKGEGITPAILYTTELQLAVFISCGPAHLAFFRRYFPRIFGGIHDPKREQQAQQDNVARRPAITDEEISNTRIQHPSYKGGVTSGLGDTTEMTPCTEENCTRRQVDVWIKTEDR